jgi:glycosyl hydrolase family 76/carbohydrate binding protein with CBM6 domain
VGKFSLLLGGLLSVAVACSGSRNGADSGGATDGASLDDSGGGPVGGSSGQSSADGGVPDAAVRGDAMVRDAAPTTLDAGVGSDARDAALTPNPSNDANTPDSAVEPDAATPIAADVAYEAFTKLFYTVRSGQAYYVNDSGTASADHWWTQAELIEMAIDAYERKPSDTYRKWMSELVYGFVAEQGRDWSYNEFNDDIAWMVIASARAHLNTGNDDFLEYARTNWDKMYARAWDTSFAGGGLWWKTDKASKNACINGPGAIGAYLLYKATADASYLTKAIEIYAWLRGALFDSKTGAVYDNLKVGGGGDDWTFTYNSGTFIGIADLLFQETGKGAYFEDAKLAADFFKSELSDGDGLVDENAITGDGAAFKPIGFRWLAKFVVANGLESTFLPWLQYNANRAWANRRADNISWNDWRKATPHMLLESTGAAATVQILQVVPAGGTPVAWYNTAPQDGRRNVEAESCDEKRGMIIEASGGNGRQLGGVMNGSWARYGHVDFTQTPPTQFVARASADSVAGGDIEIRLDSLTGSLIGTCAIASTGSWNNYAEFTAALAPQTGTHDIYLVFRPASGRAFVGNLDWFRLK